MIDDDMYNFNVILNQLDLSEDEKDSLYTRFEKSLYYGQINSYFHYLANGAYKLCYEFDSKKKYVIKFCFDYCDLSSDLDKNNEMWKEMGGKIFLHNYGFELSDNYYPDYLPEDSPGSDSYTGDDRPFISAIIIQPRISITAYDYSRYAPQIQLPWQTNEWDSPAPISDRTTKESLTFDTVRKLKIYDEDWLQLVVDLYGIEVCNKLAEVIDDYDLYDLHRQNYGYIFKGSEHNKIPVIIDY